MWFSELINHIRDLWWYSSEGQFGKMEGSMSQSVFGKDKDAPNLFVGKEIGDHVLKGRVISFDDDGIEMEIIELNDPHGRYGRYMDVGKKYPMFRHKYWTFERGLMLWEVDPKSMKRDVSQILLQWEKDIGWTWDLDM